MEQAHIANLLVPFLGEQKLNVHQLAQVSTYLDRLLRWNQRMNLTAIRDPEQVITRHFGESFFAAAELFANEDPAGKSAIDVGSGAGFPGLPIKIYFPALRMRLVEAQYRKAIFIREVIRDLELEDCEVVSERAEALVGKSAGTADLVTLRAVEHFDQVLPTAASLVSPGGRLALLIGREQLTAAKSGLSGWTMFPEIPILLSNSRVILIARK